MRIPRYSGLDRRQVMQLLAGSMLIPLVGCGDEAAGDSPDGGSSPVDGATQSTDGATVTSCSKIPEETQGPYPGDGSNGPNVLNVSGIVRHDIRSSFGSLSGTAAGVPLTIELALVDAAASCAPLAGHAVYLWHCDREGRYSLYTSGVTNQNYLRGVQAADGDGKVSFTSIFPACYTSRWPHIHFEVYPSLATAMAVGNKISTSQLALPQAACAAVYATSGYEKSVSTFSAVSLTSDTVFRDGSSLQVAETTGNVTDGYVARLVVAAK